MQPEWKWFNSCQSFHELRAILPEVAEPHSAISFKRKFISLTQISGYNEYPMHIRHIDAIKSLFLIILQMEKNKAGIQPYTIKTFYYSSLICA